MQRSDSLIDVKASFDAFLDSTTPGVIALKGDWGAGKTYFVRNHLKSRGEIKQKLISFVSLFGLSSIEEVRRQIVPSAVSSKSVKEGKSQSTIKKLIGIGRTIPKISDLEKLFCAIEDQITRDLLVVFDDVERKGNELPLQAFLGLVNSLSEYGDCKVIIILNEGELSPTDKSELNKFREKLLDQEILFAPTFEENTNIFFHDATLLEQALSTFRKCKCRNLRIIKKCHENSIAFRQSFVGLSPESKAAMLAQVVLLSCLFYQYGATIDFDSISHYRLSMFRKSDEPETNQGEIIIKEVGFWPSDFDSIIINYLRNGILDSEMAGKLLADSERTDSRESLRRQMRGIYRITNANFRGESEDFNQKMASFLDANASSLSWLEINEAVSLLKSFRYTGDTTKWTDKFILDSVPKLGLSECRSLAAHAFAEEVKGAVDSRTQEILKGRHPREIVFSMVRKQGWSPDDTAALNALGWRDYRDWFLAETDEDFLVILRQFVVTFNPTAQEPEWRQIGEKVFRAFQEIAKGSAFIRQKLLSVVHVSAECLDAPQNTEGRLIEPMKLKEEEPNDEGS